MSNLSPQRRMAAAILKVGERRVWMDPESTEDIAEAIIKGRIRELIEENSIQKKTARGVSRGRARVRMKKKALGRRKGHGSRKGAKGASMSRKRRWIIKIRALRRRLRELRDTGYIDKTTYRELYMKAKGAQFRNVAHLDNYIKTNQLLINVEE